jgi:tRNA threonylcarbamoyladenosine biosynthesis protein TsaE
MSVNTLTDSVFRQEVTSSPEQTKQMATRFAENLHPGDLVAFYGDLGSGKTFFIKALCSSLGVSREVTSPTFTIINQYVTPNNFYIYHFDFYRLENLGELRNLGLEEFFYNDYLCLVEWANKIESYLPVRRWNVILDFVPRLAQARKITIIKRDGN